VESEYAEVKAQYEELKMEVSRLEATTLPTTNHQENIYETLPFVGKDDAIGNTMEQRYARCSVCSLFLIRFLKSASRPEVVDKIYLIRSRKYL
jgi:uncharacterized protein with PIN domain